MPGDLLLLENCDIIIKIYYNSQYMMISGAKGQKAVHACMIRLLNLGPAKHEVQNIQWMFVLHRPKRSVDSSDLRSKSADFEYLEDCGSCVAA